MENTAPILNLAFLQYQPIWENCDENLKQLTSIIHQSEIDADVLILPEAFTTGFSMNAAKVSEPMDGKALTWMKETSAFLNSVVCGSIFIVENEQYFNRFIWCSPNGELSSYDKRHLFSMGNEHLNYSMGNAQVIFHYKGWKIFPQICYDVRFPVWSRNGQNYDLLINVANWPAPRRKVWKTLLKARAIENQCYVAGVNRLGKDENGIEYCGDSLIINPKGEVLVNAKTKKKVQHVALDYKQLQEFRAKFNTLKDADQFLILV